MQGVFYYLMSSEDRKQVNGNHFPAEMHNRTMWNYRGKGAALVIVA